jgi:hypothetical protein
MRRQVYTLPTFCKRIKHILPDAVSFRVGAQVAQVLIEREFVKDGKMLGLPFMIGDVASDHIQVCLRA